MEQKQYDELVSKLGAEATAKIEGLMKGYNDTLAQINTGKLSAEQFNTAKAELEGAVNDVKEIARKQGVALTELAQKINTQEVGTKSIAEQLKEDEQELANIYKNRQGVKEYMLSVNAKGQYVMKPFNTVKAAAVHTVGTSVSQSIDAASLLRLASGPIESQYRNSTWLFPLVNLINVGFDNKFFIWYDEQAKQGASATVAEGGTKPLVQYAYAINSSTYKKEAMLVSMTDEFSIDFDHLMSDIMSKTQMDLMNRINAQLLTNITSAATAYSAGTAFKAANGGVYTGATDWHAIAAIAAQAENATFATNANGVIVSTNKKYNLGLMQDTQGRWLNAPDVVSRLPIVSNPAQADANVMAGDFKQYNVALRGGVIVKVGYNGTDFASNQFSTVVEQYYYDYISSLRTPAIVKGATFAAVKTAITS